MPPAKPKPKPEKTKLRELGQGVRFVIDDKGMLLIKVDLNKDYGKTKGGNIRIASTLGNKNLDNGFEDCYLGFNLYKKIN